MATLIAHLTDMHIQSQADVLMERIERISSAISAEADESVTSIHLVVGGDLTQKGAPTEFELAVTFVRRIVEAIRAAKPLAKVELLVVPGNHDCSFVDDQTMRDIGISRVNEVLRDRGLPAESMEPVILKPLEHYFAAAQLLAPGEVHTPNEPYYRCIDKIDGAQVVRYHLLNSAWVAKKDTGPGSLLFPLQAVNPPLAGRPALSVCVLHHPMNWFKQPESMRPLRDRLEALGDIIITGHEHSGLVFGKPLYGRAGAHYVEGAVLQERGKDILSGFHVIRADAASRTFRFVTYAWKDTGDRNGYYERTVGPSETTWEPVSERCSKLRIKPAFESHLNHPGLPVTHRMRGPLRLSDFYTYPDLREVGAPGEPAGPRIKGDDAVATVIARERVVIISPDKGGRTSFGKRLFIDLHSQGLAPLLMSGQHLPKSGRPETLRERLSALVTSQYDTLAPEEYEQLPEPTRVLIIDDLHRGPSDFDTRESCLKDAHGRFGKIVYLANEQFYFEELINEETGGARTSVVEEYDHLSLLPFGFLRCEKFIRNWVLLGPNEDRSAIDSRVTEIQSAVEYVLRSNAIPHFPWIILVLVQSADSADAPAAENGSYGHLLNAIVTAALNRTKLKNLPINGKYTYLGALARHMFSKGTGYIDEEQARAFHADHQIKFGLSRIEFEPLIADFVEAGVLNSWAKEISFTHRYTYCFFVAWNLAQGLNANEPDALDVLKQLSDDLYHEDSADVIVFLAHLTTAKSVLKEVLGRATEFFRDVEPTDLDKDADPMNKIGGTVRAFVLPDGDPEENRRLLKEAEDDKLASKKSHALSGRAVKPRPILNRDADKAYESAMRITSVLRTIEILGQILRNGATTRQLDEKVQITNEVFKLARRLMAILFRTAPNVMPALISRLEENYRARFPKADDQEIASEITEHVYNLFWFASFAIIKHVASAVGDEDLADTFKAVLKDDGSVPNRIFDLAIRLDRPSPRLPTKLAEDLNDSLGKNNFAKAILKSLIVEHLYLYNVQRQEQQAICDRLEISVHRAKMLNPGEKKAK